MPRARARTIAVGALLLVAVEACSLLLLDDDYTTGMAPPDASSTDSGVELNEGFVPGVAGGDAGVDAAPENLVSNGDFSVGCDGWSLTFASGTVEPLGGAASPSCRLCLSSTSAALYMSQLRQLDVRPGAKYRGSITVRTAPNANSPGKVTLAIHVLDADKKQIQASPGGALLPQSTWNEASTLLEVSGDGGAYLRLNMTVLTGDKVICLLVDDARLNRVE